MHNSEFFTTKPDGSQEGPYSLSSLTSRIVAGKYPPGTEVWFTALPGWEPMEKHFDMKTGAPLHSQTTGTEAPSTNAADTPQQQTQLPEQSTSKAAGPPPKKSGAHTKNLPFIVCSLLLLLPIAGSAYFLYSVITPENVNEQRTVTTHTDKPLSTTPSAAPQQSQQKPAPNEGKFGLFSNSKPKNIEEPTKNAAAQPAPQVATTHSTTPATSPQPSKQEPNPDDDMRGLFSDSEPEDIEKNTNNTVAQSAPQVTGTNNRNSNTPNKNAQRVTPLTSEEIDEEDIDNEPDNDDDIDEDTEKAVAPNLTAEQNKTINACKKKLRQAYKRKDKTFKTIALYIQKIQLHDDCRDCYYSEYNCSYDKACRHWATTEFDGKRMRVSHQLPQGSQRYSGIDQAISSLEIKIISQEKILESLNATIDEQRQMIIKIAGEDYEIPEEPEYIYEDFTPSSGRRSSSSSRRSRRSSSSSSSSSRRSSSSSSRSSRSSRDY